jgi:hypothetical protein|tara:strand:+ start:560 stop:958 length:399 start_codon:yes stop_codon:yes gene_type:complete
MAKKKTAKAMMTPTSSAGLGRIAFLLGFAVALVAGLIGAVTGLGNYAGWISLILVILGIVVGFLNIHKAERQSFIIAAIALSMLGLVSFNALVLGSFNLGGYLTSVLAHVLTFVAPAAAIAAVYEIYDLARN